MTLVATDVPVGHALRQAGVPREHITAAAGVLAERLIDAAARLQITEDQRESARRWAVHYEQGYTEYLRRVNIALAVVGEWWCECTTVPSICGDPDFTVPCKKCLVLPFLLGDK